MFDRLFGTFVPERRLKQLELERESATRLSGEQPLQENEEALHYGLVHPLRTFDPFLVQVSNHMRTCMARVAFNVRAARVGRAVLALLGARQTGARRALVAHASRTAILRARLGARTDTPLPTRPHPAGVLYIPTLYSCVLAYSLLIKRT